ncbi:hypothetical protein ACWEXP_00780 [Staphylococcus pseudoxylosus]|uniref:Uncharacterized protein n=1 Tax=Staphylococcus pseudoxylosus TaxID=2282419 RepID=A0AAQ0S6Z8_9STAP|nr:hypothetical protein [Staphylococcus pseudoxylosus]MCE5003234.1 hypothetical protein [Staphylococcus pseudoxylosus]RMI84976.1 hypothetical protein D9V42_08955 [Staphylococcus pseudoxylosus]
MNVALAILTGVLVMMLSLVFTNDFAHLTVIYFATFFIAYCWFWPEFFKAIKKTAKRANA